MEELEKKIKKLMLEIDSVMREQDIVGKERKLKEAEARTDYRDYKQVAQLEREKAKFNRGLGVWREGSDMLDYLIKLAKTGDESLRFEIEKEYKKISDHLENLKKELRFNGPFDDHDAILSLHAGAGGTDAQDWAQMLQRMYLRWAEANGLKAEIIDQSASEEAGIKSATIKLSGGSFLYGKLAGEHGVHRLVRLSPFNADNLRQTSFAKVEILPSIDKPDELQIDDKDLKIDVYRAGGHGGQSVNTTDSAVRVTHLPTGISVSVQNERSQLQNRATALGILRSRLAALQLEQHAQNLADIKGPNQSAEWGNQIRNYVLHPYKQVKDTRTGYESSDVEKVLDGNLNPLIDAWLEKH